MLAAVIGATELLPENTICGIEPRLCKHAVEFSLGIPRASAMPIMGYNYAAAMLLTELHIQCTIAKRTYTRLREAAAHWIALESGRDFDSAAPPADIVADCTTMLAALASIRRFLFENDRRSATIRNRCRKLRGLLGNPMLPILSSAEVRNSWEHMDERLDVILPQMQVGQSMSHVHVSASPPNPSTIALHHFDPRNMTIRFAGQSVPLDPAMKELEGLASAVDRGFQRLHTERVDVWDV